MTAKVVYKLNCDKVGNPTVSNKCVYSGFSTSNYLRIPQNLKNTSYTYIFKFTTGNSFSAQQTVVHGEYFLNIEITTGGLVQYYNWGSDNSGTILTASTNTTYWVKCAFNGNQKTFSYSTDGVNWTGISPYTDSNLKPDDTRYEFRIGLSSYSSNNPFLGSVDMMDAKILDSTGNIVWKGVSEEEVYLNGSVYISKGYYNNGTQKIILGNGSYTYDEMSINQTLGCKNDLYAYNDGEKSSVLICKKNTQPTGTFSNLLKLSAPIYLNYTKNIIVCNNFNKPRNYTFGSGNTEAKISHSPTLVYNDSDDTTYWYPKNQEIYLDAVKEEQTLGIKNNLYLTNKDGQDESNFTFCNGIPNNVSTYLQEPEYVFLTKDKNYIKNVGTTAKNELDVSYEAFEPSGYKDFDIVGDVNITDGIINGTLNSSNYIYKNISTDTSKPFEFTTKVRFTSFPSIYNSILDCNNYSLFFGYSPSNSKFQLYLGSNGSSWNIASELTGGSCQLDTDYWFKIGWTGTKYYVQSSTDGTTFTEIITCDSSTAIYSFDKITIAYYTGDGTWSFTGYYDLNEVSYSADNSLIWTPYSQVKENFTRVGSPTIEDGIVSGFSENNYLIYGNPTFYSNPWEMQLKFTANPISEWFKLTGSQTDFKGGNSFGVGATNVLQWEATTNGSSWDINLIVDDMTIETNTYYWARMGWTGSLYYLDISTDGVNFIRKKSVSNSSPLVYTEPLWIGKTWHDSNTDHYWRGSLDLNDCYIKENNQIIWTPFTIGQFNGTLTVSKGYDYCDETYGYIEFDSDETKKIEECIIHPEDFSGTDEKYGYMFIIKPTSSTSDFIVCGLQNPTKQYIGSVCNPVIPYKKIVLDETMSKLLSVEDYS